MKFGVLLQKNNLNIGDDIQAYASARFLPSLDYQIDRETLDSFQSEQNEPVAVIMCAWYMWRKWNWPPAPNIIPKFLGFHYADHQRALQPGSPIKYEFLTGLGGEYLKTYGAIGARDMFTKESLEKNGIPSYFSGCITLTLPEQPKINVKEPYICLVDIDAPVVKKIKKDYKDCGIEFRVKSHNRERNEQITWEERVKLVEERLTEYQNAVCVVTKRLHCALPCLAMNVPLLLVKEWTDDTRFSPYYEWFHWSRTSDFLAGKCEFDLANPLPNKGLHMETRNQLIASIEEFVKQAQEGKLKAAVLPYTEDELLRWRHDEMKKAMDNWYLEHRDLYLKKRSLNKQVTSLKTDLKNYDQLKEENKKLYHIVNCRIVKWAIKFRNLFKKDKIEIPIREDS